MKVQQVSRFTIQSRDGSRDLEIAEEVLGPPPVNFNIVNQTIIIKVVNMHNRYMHFLDH